MDLSERQKRKEHIKELTSLERGVYADMIMRSLRGSWRNPRRRAKILEFIGETDNVEYYDSDTLCENVDSYFNRIGRGMPDGRYWRGKYQEADVDHSVLEERRLRELASRIPDDLTWVDYRINKVYDND
jgi:hypothetical protein